MKSLQIKTVRWLVQADIYITTNDRLSEDVGSIPALILWSFSFSLSHWIEHVNCGYIRFSYVNIVSWTSERKIESIFFVESTPYVFSDYQIIFKLTQIIFNLQSQLKIVVADVKSRYWQLFSHPPPSSYIDLSHLMIVLTDYKLVMLAILKIACTHNKTRQRKTFIYFILHLQLFLFLV